MNNPFAAHAVKIDEIHALAGVSNPYLNSIHHDRFSRRDSSDDPRIQAGARLADLSIRERPDDKYAHPARYDLVSPDRTVRLNHICMESSVIKK